MTEEQQAIYKELAETYLKLQELTTKLEASLEGWKRYSLNGSTSTIFSFNKAEELLQLFNFKFPKYISTNKKTMNEQDEHEKTINEQDEHVALAKYAAALAVASAGYNFTVEKYQVDYTNETGVLYSVNVNLSNKASLIQGLWLTRSHVHDLANFIYDMQDMDCAMNNLNHHEITDSGMIAQPFLPAVKQMFSLTLWQALTNFYAHVPEN